MIDMRLYNVFQRFGKTKNRIDENWKKSILKILANVEMEFFDREKTGKKKKKKRIERKIKSENRY